MMARQRVVAALVVALAALVPLAAQQGRLVDRVVAVVSGTIITMTDARAAVEFGFVTPSGTDGDPVAAAVTWLINRQLILEEAARYGAAAPEGAAVDAIVARLRAAAPTPEAFAARLARLGLDEADLRTLVRQNLLADAYVDRRFDAIMAVTETDAEEYYRLRVDRFVRDGRRLSFDEVRDEVYRVLGAERRARAVADWLASLRRRAEIHELYLPRK